jgi:hypothetical protein
MVIGNNKDDIYLSIKKQTPHAVTCGIVKNYFLSAATAGAATAPAAPVETAVELPEALPAAAAAEAAPPADGATTALCGATGAATEGEVCVDTAGAETSTTGAVVEVEPAAGAEVLLVQPTNIAAATAVITSVFILFSFILEYYLLIHTSSTALRQNRYLF